MSRACLPIGAALWACAVLGPAALVRASEDSAPPAIVSFELGFDGWYKLGKWTPLRVQVRGGGRRVWGEIHARLPDGEGVPVRFVSEYLTLEPEVSQWQIMVVKCGRAIERLELTFCIYDYEVWPPGPNDEISGWASCTPKADRTPPRREFTRLVSRGFTPADPTLAGKWPRALPPSGRLIVAIGDTVGFGPWPDRADAPVVARFSDSLTLPILRCAGAYEGVDAVVVADRESSDVLKMMRSIAERAWLFGGGKYVSLGNDFFGGKGDGTSTVTVLRLRNVDSLDAYVGGPDAGATPLGGGKPVTLFLYRERSPFHLREQVIVREGEAPLVTSRVRDGGLAVFVGFDFNAPLFAEWPRRPLLVEKLLGEVGIPLDRSRQGPKTRHTGSRGELAHDLGEALDAFTEVRTISFGWVALLGVGLLVLVGPLDYWIVARLVRRTELTWCTHALFAVGVCLGTDRLAATFKTDGVCSNQIDVVDLEDELSPTGTCTSFLGLFSARATSVDLDVVTLDWPERRTESWACPKISWLGVPGMQWGGMHARDPVPQGSNREYAIQRSGQLEGAPLDVASSRLFTAFQKHGVEYHAGFADRQVSQLRANGEYALSGQITWTRKVTLERPLLVHAHGAYVLPTLHPGDSVEVGDLPNRDLASVWTNDEGDDVSDLDRAIRAILFAARTLPKDGSGKTNDFHSRLDMSSLLRPGTAILVGRATAPLAVGVQWLNHGERLGGRAGDRHIAYVRVVLDVQESGG